MDRFIDFERVYVAVAGRDTAETINAKLSSHSIDAVVFSAGIYHLDDTLMVSQSDFVLLGLGLATLIPTTGLPAITVRPGLSNVRVASVLLQASSVKSRALLDWGAVGDTCAGCVISDLFTRVGGPDGTFSEPVAVDIFVHLKSGGIVGDNLWLWRADHTHQGVGTHPSQNPCKNGIIVDGDDVTMYGLAVEHTLEDMTVWNGERGRTFFYQSELPYGVDDTWGTQGYVGYRVSEHVQSHASYGVGVYHYFRDHSPAEYTGIKVPESLVDSMVAPIGVYLNGLGAMRHVINGIGAATQRSAGQSGAVVAYTCIGHVTSARGSFDADVRNASLELRDFTPPGVMAVSEEGDQVNYFQSSMSSAAHEL